MMGANELVRGGELGCGAHGIEPNRLGGCKVDDLEFSALVRPKGVSVDLTRSDEWQLDAGNKVMEHGESWSLMLIGSAP